MEIDEATRLISDIIGKIDRESTLYANEAQREIARKEIEALVLAVGIMKKGNVVVRGRAKPRPIIDKWPQE